MKLREFYPNGRSTFFHVHPKDFWLTGKRSGIFPKSLFTPATQCAGLVLPFLLSFGSAFTRPGRYCNRDHSFSFYSVMAVDNLNLC